MALQQVATETHYDFNMTEYAPYLNTNTICGTFVLLFIFPLSAFLSVARLPV
jgi:hypothetical protein